MIESIRDRKTVEEIIQNRKTAKKIRSKPKTACKTVKTDKFSHLTYKHSNRSDTWHVVSDGDKWSIQRFRGFSRSVEAHNCHSDQRETETQIAKTENRIGYQIWKHISVFNEYRKPSA